MHRETRNKTDISGKKKGKRTNHEKQEQIQNRKVILKKSSNNKIKGEHKQWEQKRRMKEIWIYQKKLSIFAKLLNQITFCL